MNRACKAHGPNASPSGGPQVCHLRVFDCGRSRGSTRYHSTRENWSSEWFRWLRLCSPFSRNKPRSQIARIAATPRGGTQLLAKLDCALAGGVRFRVRLSCNRQASKTPNGCVARGNFISILLSQNERNSYLGGRATVPFSTRKLEFALQAFAGVGQETVFDRAPGEIIPDKLFVYRFDFPL